MKKILLFLALGFCGFIALPTYATTWYVDANSGSDSVTCTATTNPCKTIQQAVANLVGGDTVYLNGTFAEAVTINATKSGSASSYTTIATWPGNNQAIINSGVHSYFHINGASYVNIENINFNNSWSGIYINNSASNIIINRVSINNNIDIGLFISNCSNIQIKNSLIYNNQLSGLDIRNSSNVSVVNNSFYRNTVININWQLSNTNIMKNNVIAMGETGVMLDFNSLAILSSDYNNIYNQTTAAFLVSSTYYTLSEWQSHFSQDLNSKETDPLFVSTTAGFEDFHLQSTSPAIDAGADLTASGITTDYDNEIRPYASAFDIGADELPIVTAPTSPVVSDTANTTATLSWTAPTTGITSYTLEYGTDSAYAAVSALTGLTAVTANLTGLTSNTTYYYRIKALYNTYESSYVTGSFLTDPDKPTVFLATERKAKTMTVSWTPPSGTMTEYAVTYYDINDTSNITELRTTDTTLQITDLNSNTEYHLACFALNGYSISESADFLVARTLPTKVKNVKVPAKYLTATTAKIKWKKPANNTGLTYRVKLMNKKGKKIKIYKATKLSKLISKLTPNTTYKVKVRAKYDAENKGAWSEVAKFRTK